MQAAGSDLTSILHQMHCSKREVEDLRTHILKHTLKQQKKTHKLVEEPYFHEIMLKRHIASNIPCDVL